ncbi:hypothetical protein GGI22_004040, partial [Coemansia erecta]
MKPPGGTSATGLGALSNAEFHGINPAYSYADIVDFAASLPTMPSGIAAEYKYERDRSSD